MHPESNGRLAAVRRRAATSSVAAIRVSPRFLSPGYVRAGATAGQCAPSKRARASLVARAPMQDGLPGSDDDGGMSRPSAARLDHDSLGLIRVMTRRTRQTAT